MSFTLQGVKCLVGIKPCLVFTGDLFQRDDNYIRLKSVLLGRS